MTTILTIADQLKIRGLCSDQQKNEKNAYGMPAAVVGDKYANDESNVISINVSEINNAQNSNTSHLRAAKPVGHGGRKGYLPKKLRMSGDSDSARSGGSPHYPTLSPESLNKDEGIRTPETDGAPERKSGDENGGDDYHEDQPVDFSATASSYKPRYSILSKYTSQHLILDEFVCDRVLILGNYLKSGKGEKRKRQNLLPLENGLEDQMPQVPDHAASIGLAAEV